MTVTVTIRPNGARTEVSGLPWTGRPADNYALLEGIIDATRAGQVRYAGGMWSVSRPHTVNLVNGLAARFGQVHVVHYGGLKKCVERCWTGDPEFVYLCQCSCAGDNHGIGYARGKIVAQSAVVGDIAVESLPPREYDVFG
jgi:hypothetical protein